MSYRSGHQSEFQKPHDPSRQSLARQPANPSAAPREENSYTLVHAGKQVRVGPVVFWIVVGTITA
ncbi:MAG TPA: M23 family peptidase, partial [Xanthobacteraceae bacterium]